MSKEYTVFLLCPLKYFEYFLIIMELDIYYSCFKRKSFTFLVYV